MCRSCLEGGPSALSPRARGGGGGMSAPHVTAAAAVTQHMPDAHASLRSGAHCTCSTPHNEGTGAGADACVQAYHGQRCVPNAPGSVVVVPGAAMGACAAVSPSPWDMAESEGKLPPALRPAGGPLVTGVMGGMAAEPPPVVVVVLGVVVVPVVPLCGHACGCGAKRVAQSAAEYRAECACMRLPHTLRSHGKPAANDAPQPPASTSRAHTSAPAVPGAASSGGAPAGAGAMPEAPVVSCCCCSLPGRVEPGRAAPVGVGSFMCLPAAWVGPSLSGSCVRMVKEWGLGVPGVHGAKG